MLTATMLHDRFTESCQQITKAISSITHTESLREPFPDVQPIHWLVGHVVVSRANFLTLLGVPSIWPWPICKWFIPGSSATAESAEGISFKTLRLDLQRTQEMLVTALAQTSPAELAVLQEDRPISEHLLQYATHEAYHAGQITLLQQILLKTQPREGEDE